MIAVNKSTNTSIFPNNAKIASALQILQTWKYSNLLKFHESVTKNELLKSMNVHIPLLYQHIDRITMRTFRQNKQWEEY